MSQRTLEERVADLERQVAELSANSQPHEGGMTGAELVAYMKVHGEALRPIFEEALKLREQDRAKVRRRVAREDGRTGAKKRKQVGRQRVKA
jgi:hypothetical protein